MIFSSVQFLFVFLPAVLVLYYLAPKKAKNAVLLAFSLVFYAWGGVRYLVLIGISILVNYLAGLLLDRCTSLGARRAALAAGVVFNLSLLGYFKYFDFFASTVNAAAGSTLIAVRGIVLPIGISFYTFQAMSYLIDLYRRQIAVQKSLLRFALYIALFPQLIAGPIVRYCEIEGQLQSRGVTVDDFCYGIKRFVLGLGKKTLLANPLGAVFAAITSARTGDLPWQLLLTAYGMYSLQLYYDFSGYSDMAIGLGRMFGFRFPENFNYPYLSRSVGEYWRRWHITLSGWFREYLYFPLGGSRKGTIRTCVNLIVVFLLTGLWHGAAWQYAVFGLYHGMVLILERQCIGKWLERHPALAHLYTLVVLQTGLVVFGANGLRTGLASLKGIYTLQAGDGAYNLSQFMNPRICVILLAAILLCGPLQALCRPLRERLYREDALSVPEMVGLAAVLFFSVMAVTANSYNPFIYYRF